ncbi:MAG: LamG-like jellyroll fold domain-containing protein, partial [Planctomycetaceae bacterium]
MIRMAVWLLLAAGSVVAAQDAKTALVDGRFAQALDASKGGFVAAPNVNFGKLPVTAELWFKPSQLNRSQTLLSSGMRVSGTSWRLNCEAGTGRLSVELPGFRPNRLIARAGGNANQWRYAAIVLEPRRVRVFDSGQLVIDQPIQSLGLPVQSAGFGVGVSIDNRLASAVQIDDVRVSSIARDIVGVPNAALIKDENTIELWNFDESEADYLSKWTPSGETNQPGLPYAHREAGYELEKDKDWADARWQQTDKGRFITHSTLIPTHAVSPKNMTIFPGDRKDFALMFDLQRCGVMAVIDDATFKIDEFRFGLLRKPTLQGDLRAYAFPQKLWRDYSRNRQPLPLEATDYKQLLTNPGKAPTLQYSVAGATFTETYRVTERDGQKPVLTRFLKASNVSRALELTLAEVKGMPKAGRTDGAQIVTVVDGNRTYGFTIPTATQGAELGVLGKDVVLRFAPGPAHEVAISYFEGESFVADSNNFPEAGDKSLREWGEPLVTTGAVGSSDGDESWVLDTVEIPFENPHKALFYITALDFFPDGRAALATAHGDVWVVDGLDQALTEVRWHRFATGLYQPLGLEVANGKVIVLGRDQLTRLHDTDGNGEADIYESFNNDLIINGADHAYAMRLEQDRAGNFYFLKSGQKPHGRSLLRVTADGSSLEVLASGFRHPYGMGVSGEGEVTVADNEGPWVPSSKIDLIKRGGFYGFLGSAKQVPAGVRPEQPLCWIPKVADNSSGGQMWNTSSTWGPYHQGGMLHLSWGRCTMHAVLRDVVGGVQQGATVQFPGLTFLSGSGEAEFNPKDGQLYVVGLDGWQTGAVQDGSLQRVRY